MFAVGSLLFGQTQTGTITGTVKDETGAVLPGVTVTLTSPDMLGTRTMVTTERGSYQFVSLPVGFYEIKFELEGFTPVERKEIRMMVAFVARIDVTMTIAALAETITVSGESPVVDVKTVLKASTFDSTLLDNLPSARDPWVMSAMAPGAQPSLFNIAGTESFQQYGVSVHGASAGASMNIDGQLVNWTGGSAMIYFGFGMYKEMAIQTNAQPAEVESPGMSWNMVTGSGGNEWHGEGLFLFMNQGLAFDNISSEQRALGMEGNPIDISVDTNAKIGGPIMKDKMWIFGVARYWRMDQVMTGAKLKPGQGKWIDDNSIRNFFGKVTYQVNPSNTLAFNWNRNYKYRYHRTPTDPRTWLCEPDATFFQDQIGNSTQGQLTSIISDKAFLDLRAGIMFGSWPMRWQDNVSDDTIGKSDQGLMVYYDAPPDKFINPNYRISSNNSLSYFVDDFMGGAHSIKTGLQFGRCFSRYEYRQNSYGITQRYMYGEPMDVTLYNYPVNTESMWNSYGIYLQDDFTLMERLTLNLGLRFDRYAGWVPAHSSPAGPWFPERTTEKVPGIPEWNNIAPRIGFAYDLFGDGKTAIKGNISRYYGRLSHGLAMNVDPTGTGEDLRTWTDLNGDDIAQLEEMGPSTGWDIGASRKMDPDLRNSYEDEMTLGIEREVATDFNLGLTYYRRSTRDDRSAQNIMVNQDDYHPVVISNSLTGELNTVYEIDAAKRALYSAVYTNNPLDNTDYNGVELTWTKRYSHGWQMMGGFTVQKNWGGMGGDPGNPNSYILQEGVVGNDSTYIFKILGSYMLPYDIMFSGNFRYQTGYPLSLRLYARGFNQGTFYIRPAERGEHRMDNVTLLDLRLSKTLNISDNYKLELMADIYNATNTNIATRQNTTVGAALFHPTMIMTPRTIRLGARFIF